MNHIKKFESFNISYNKKSHKDRYEEFIEQIKNSNIGDILSNETIYMFVQYLTILSDKYEDSFVDGDLGERLDEYDNYILKEIDIDDLNLDEWNLDYDLVDHYQELYHENKTYPPIVIDDNFSIIDGTHRANAIKNIGFDKILAFVGLD